jgi:hypothetical protein
LMVGLGLEMEMVEIEREMVVKDVLVLRDV